MKFFAPWAAVLRPRNAMPMVPGATNGMYLGGTPQSDYMRYAAAYMGNPTVFACVEMLATSAAEPHIVGRRYRRESPRIRAERAKMQQARVPLGEIERTLIENGFYEELPDHPLVQLLNNPNPLMSRGQLWGTVVMDRALIGNAYLLKARVQSGPLNGAVKELWRLRPDRVKIIPKVGGVEGYEYNTGRDKIVYRAEDVMHFKTRSPLNDYYGDPPLRSVIAAIGIDNNMTRFLQDFFQTGGMGPGAVLSMKQKVGQEGKDEIRERLARTFSGTGAGKTLVIDANEHTYTQLGLNRGLRDALPKEISNSIGALIAMNFGIPGSLIGLPIAYDTGNSYANKRQDWQVFWDLTMAPLMSDLDDVLNLSMLQDFGRIDEVGFFLAEVPALQEDKDKLHDRLRADYAAGAITFEEMRDGLGYNPDLKEGTLLVPSNMTPISIRRFEESGDEEPVAPEPAQLPAPQNIVAEVYCPKCGRWVGRNMNVGATAYCPKDKEVAVTLPGESKVISISVVRDEDGRVQQLVGGE